LFEPAEETVPGGAPDVIADGGLDGVSAIYGFHCDPKLDVGRFGLRVGPLTAATDLVRVTLRGPGGHTARPHLTVDLVAVAGRVAADLPAIVRRIVGDRGAMLVVFGSLHAGDAANVIPTVARLQGSVRVPDRVLWDETETILISALDELVGDTGVQIELDHQRGIPPVVNHAAEIERMRRAIESVVDPDAVTEAVQSFGGDSFSWYLERVPGAYVRIGVADPLVPLDQRLDLHSGAFDVDERVVALGSRVLAEVATSRLAEG
jgi:amidohydrolase